MFISTYKGFLDIVLDTSAFISAYFHLQVLSGKGLKKRKLPPGISTGAVIMSNAILNSYRLH